MKNISLFFIVVRLFIFAKAIGNGYIFNVLNYGAVGDGVTDDTKAFMEAWGRACNARLAHTIVLIPKTRSFLVRQTTFAGPCSTINLKIMLLGTIIAPNGPNEWNNADLSTWLTFNGVNRLNIDGPGSIDGRGSGWWDISCRYHPQLKGCGNLAPTIIKFQNCNNVAMKLIWLRNSPQTHITLLGTNNVKLFRLNITSPGNSPNTDGIHLQSCDQVFIHNINIEAGDDCISIGDYTTNINITNIKCGPGHGISIGSLGRDGNEAHVENINVNTASFIGTTNGVRIKTWQAGKGQARGITFANLNFTGVSNPIDIDQYYCDVPFGCLSVQSGVEIRDVSYHNAFGSSATKIGINLNCSNVVPCNNIILDNVILDSSVPGQEVEASCNYVHGSSFGTVKPNYCLQP